mgnify:CR=1 FL=1
MVFDEVQLVKLHLLRVITGETLAKASSQVEVNLPLTTFAARTFTDVDFTPL